jgi:hypothetical protein
MSELNIIPFATASPTECIRCHTPKGPFLDFNVEVLGYGHVYICLGSDENPGCLPQAARLAGYADPDARSSLEAKVRELTIENSRLTSQVAPLAAAFDAFREFEQAEADKVAALAIPPAAPAPKVTEAAKIGPLGPLTPPPDSPLSPDPPLPFSPPDIVATADIPDILPPPLSPSIPLPSEPSPPPPPPPPANPKAG